MCVYMDNVGNNMDANEHTNNQGYDNTPQRHKGQKSEESASQFHQVFCGRRILASKYEEHAQTTILSSLICTQKSKNNIRDVQLKDSTGMVVGRGIVEFELQTKDDVDRLILFLHQVAVQVMDIYASGV